MAESHVVHSHLTYLEGSTENGHALDLFEPERTDTNSKLFPLVVYIHGGGWTERDKKDFDHIALDCVSHNFSCAIINYRLSPLTVPEGSEDHFKHPGHVEDCAAAFSFLYSNASKYHYDVDNVIVIGHSAGGFMAAQMQFEARINELWRTAGKGLRVRHYIGLQGIYDLTSILKDFGNDYLTYMIAPAFGWSAESHEKASPTKTVLDISNGQLPTPEQAIPWTLVWSDKDTMVNKRQSEEFEAALKAVKVPVTHDVLSPDDAEAGSHHGVTTKAGFSRYVLPILLRIAAEL